jgi:hypothetical protein
MSVQSITNGQLQLSELIVSNEKYSNATGYLASQATINSGKTRVSMTVPLFSTEQVTIAGAGNTQSVTIGSNSTNDFLVSTTTGNGLTILSGSTSCTLTVPGAGILGVPILRCSGLQDSVGSTGLAGQVPTANGLGGWVWATP